MQPSDVEMALSKLNNTFKSFDRQVTGRSKSIEVMKERIKVEEKCYRLNVLQADLLKKKKEATQGLTLLLGSETAKVEDLQKKIVEQHKKSLMISDTLRKIEQNHTEAMTSRKRTIEKFKNSFQSRLDIAVKKRWKEEEEHLNELDSMQEKLKKKVLELKAEAERKEVEFKRKESELDQEVLKRQSEMEKKLATKMKELERKKAQLEREYKNLSENMMVQSEVKIGNLRKEYDAKRRELMDIQKSSVCEVRQPTPSKSSKRKLEHPYLSDYEDR